MQRLTLIFLGVAIGTAASGCTSSDGGWMSAPKRWFGGSQRSRQEDSAPRGARAEIGNGARSDRFEQATELVRKRRFKEALALIDEELERTPRSKRFLSLKGDALYQMRRYEEAAEAYQASRTVAPNYYPALRGLAFVRLNQAKEARDQSAPQEAFDYYRKALTLLREAQRRLPSDDDVIYARAWAAEGVARFYYNRALTLRAREDRHGAETQGDNCRQFCREALKSVRAYLDDRPKNALAHALEGRIRLRLAMLEHDAGHLDLAIRYLQQSIRAWKGILRQVDRDDETARAEVDRLEVLLGRWRAERKTVGGLP